MAIEITTKSETETMDLGKSLAEKFREGGVFCLYGDLGTGKTCFTKGFAAGLGLKKNQIKSPTYTYMRSYKTNGAYMHHCDFYRINEADPLMNHDLEGIFSNKKNWVIIEWPERIENQLPPGAHKIYFEYIDQATRLIRVDEYGET